MRSFICSLAILAVSLSLSTSIAHSQTPNHSSDTKIETSGKALPIDFTRKLTDADNQPLQICDNEKHCIPITLGTMAEQALNVGSRMNPTGCGDVQQCTKDAIEATKLMLKIHNAKTVFLTSDEISQIVHYIAQLPLSAFSYLNIARGRAIEILDPVLYQQM